MRVTVNQTHLITAVDHFEPRADPPVMQENRRTGTTSWRLDVSHSDDIEGYASRTDVAAGGAFEVMVRTRARSFSAYVYRMGWYRGLGGRLIERIANIAGDPQTPCPTTPNTLTTICSWRPTFAIRTRSTWVSGVYLVKLVATREDESYVAFVVREAKPRAPILFQSSVTTWQAYNMWGGRDLYFGPCAHAPGECRDQRSRAVSFDRPYIWPGASGRPPDFFGLEFPLLSLLERNGYDVAYATDVSLQEKQEDLPKRAVFISAGHDEYYSVAMRDALQSALDHGTSLAFMGANDIFRRIRFIASAVGPDRIEVNYKNAAEDPDTKTHPELTTANWPDGPYPQPEQLLIGSQYGCANVHGDWTASGKPAWLFEGTGLEKGSIIPNLIAREADFIDSKFPLPGGVITVGSGRILCGATKQIQAGTTIYFASSGAGVFDAGSLYFDCALGPHPEGCSGFGAPVQASVGLQRLVMNFITSMLKRAR